MLLLIHEILMGSIFDFMLRHIIICPIWMQTIRAISRISLIFDEFAFKTAQIILLQQNFLCSSSWAADEAHV